MKLGLSSFSFGWAVGVKPYDTPAAEKMDLMDLIEKTHFYGLHLLQVGDNIPLDCLEQTQLDEARQLLELYDIELELGARGLLDDVLDSYIKLAQFFHSKLIRIVIDKDQYEPSPSKIVSTICRYKDKFESQGIYLAIENHDRLRALELTHIIEKIDSPYVGICLDTANSLGAEQGIVDVLEMLLKHTINLHIKDYTIRRIDYMMGFVVEGAAAGSGRLDIPHIIKEVTANGRHANCILEQWTPLQKNIQATIDKEKCWVDEGIAYLKRFV